VSQGEDDALAAVDHDLARDDVTSARLHDQARADRRLPCLLHGDHLRRGSRSAGWTPSAFDSFHSVRSVTLRPASMRW